MTNSKKTYTSIPEFIKLAIQFEADSVKFYEGLHDKVEDQEVREILAMLSKEELKHQRKLEEYEVRENRGFLQFSPSLTDLMPPVPDVLPDVNACLELGLAREEKSVDIYEKAAGMTTGDFRDVLHGLANFERQHVEKIGMLKRFFQ